jgi:hypothetical protein
MVSCISLLAAAALVACSPPETENRFQKAVAENLCPDDPQPVMDMLSATEQEEHVWLVTKDSGDHAGASWLVTEAEGNSWNFEAQNEEGNTVLNSSEPTCS